MKWNNYYADLNIPADWKDSCSGNDLLPSFSVVRSEYEYQIFIDSYDSEIRAINTEDITGSKSPLIPRFTVQTLSSDGVDIIEDYQFFETLNEVLAFIDKKAH